MGRVLIVEDDGRVRNALARNLRTRKHVVQVCPSKAEASRLIQGAEKPFDVVVADMDLGPADTEGGVDVLQAARQAAPYTQVIVYTAYGTLANVHKCAKHNLFDYIDKGMPNANPALYERVDAAVEEAKYRRDLLPEVDTAPDPFELSWADHEKMSERQRADIEIVAWEMHHDWIRKQLAKRNAAWIMVAGKKVIDSSPTLDDYPFPPGVMEIAEKRRQPVFVFVQPPQLYLAGAVGTGETVWQQHPFVASDSFVTLKMKVGRPIQTVSTVNSRGLGVIALFDTGAGQTILDMKTLLSKKVVSPNELGARQRACIAAWKYAYRLARVKIVLRNTAGDLVQKVITCQAFEGRVIGLTVRRDTFSDLLCSSTDVILEGLAGRDVMIAAKPLLVELEGKRLVTRIMP